MNTTNGHLTGLPNAEAEQSEISLPSAPQETDFRLHRRFDRMGRLVGDAAMKKLNESHVMVIGLGGVGSWAAESLARSGVGTLTLVDFDQICITNTNRQLHALGGLVGEHKALVLAERFKKINPQITVHARVEFYNERTSESILGNSSWGTSGRGPSVDYIIDAIDSVTAKCHLIATCRRLGIPLVTSTGSGGRLDPTRIQVCDLSETEIDPLARSVRKILRGQYGFPEKGPFGIPAVFSNEEASMPLELAYDKGKGFTCVCPQGQNDYFNCDNRNLILGNAAFVTGAFGLACASRVVRDLIAARQ